MGVLEIVIMAGAIGLVAFTVIFNLVMRKKGKGCSCCSKKDSSCANCGKDSKKNTGGQNNTDKNS